MAAVQQAAIFPVLVDREYGLMADGPVGDAKFVEACEQVFPERRAPGRSCRLRGRRGEVGCVVPGEIHQYSLQPLRTRFANGFRCQRVVF